jgi:hypothetical protein
MLEGRRSGSKLSQPSCLTMSTSFLFAGQITSERLKPDYAENVLAKTD